VSSEKSEKVCHGIGSWIVSTAHAFRRALECELSQQGVTFRQWEVMAWLNADGEQPQTDLADKMGLEAQTLAGIISRMERDGWLSRKSCCEDRRRKLIAATPKAMEIWNEMRACCDQVKERAMQGLSEQELNQLESVCSRIRTNLETECPEIFDEHQAVMKNCVSESDCGKAVGEETESVNLEDTRTP